MFIWNISFIWADIKSGMVLTIITCAIVMIFRIIYMFMAWNFIRVF